MLVADAMLMAAGLGTRLRPFTDVCPKAVLPLLGVPMAQFAADALAEAGVARVVANLHHHAQVAEADLRKLDFQGADLQISDESDLLLGSAGGIRKALPRFGGRPFFLLNADVLMDLDLSALARAHARLRARHGVVMTLAVLAVPPPGGKYREIRVESSGLVSGFGDVVEGKPFFTGAAILEEEALKNVPPEGPSEFRDMILAPAIAAGRAGAFVVNGLWRDVGSPELWHRTHFDLLEKLETGALTSRLRRRLDSANRRVAQGFWVSRKAGTVCRMQGTAPCYWAPGEGSFAAPRELGPEAVLYGSPASGVLAHGIGFAGRWVQVSSGEVF